MLLSENALFCQDSVFGAINKSQNTVLQYRIWLHAAGNSTKNSGLHTSTSPLFSYTKDTIYHINLNLGIQAEIFYPKYPISMTIGLGYTGSTFRYENDFGTSNGMKVGWLTTDASVNVYCFMVGCKNHFYLGGDVKNPDNFCYSGFSTDFINRNSFSWYLGIFAKLSNISLSVSGGFFLKTMINPDKMAAHNLTSTRVSGSYFEISASFLLFTSGSRTKQNPNISL
jgi:hypothetical protein